MRIMQPANRGLACRITCCRLQSGLFSAVAVNVWEAHEYMHAIQPCNTHLYCIVVTSWHCVLHHKLAIKCQCCVVLSHVCCACMCVVTSCPVCRYVQTPVPTGDNKCFECSTQLVSLYKTVCLQFSSVCRCMWVCVCVSSTGQQQKAFSTISPPF